MAVDHLIIPGTGSVYIGDVDAVVPDITKIKYGDESTYTSWKWLGHTSRENTVALSKEGGEVTTNGSWEDPNLRSEVSNVTWSATVNSLEVSKETLKLAIPAGDWDEATASIAFGGNTGTVDKAVLVVMNDSKNGAAAFYFPNASISLGEAPSINLEGFFEVQLNVSAQGSPTTGKSIQWFIPRKTAPAGVGG